MSGEVMRELRRVTAHGHSASDASPATLVAIQGIDGSWTVHALGVRLSGAAIVTLASSILDGVRGGYGGGGRR